jgi:hypothetical protein
MHDVTFDLGDNAAFATSTMKRGDGGGRGRYRMRDVTVTGNGQRSFCSAKVPGQSKMLKNRSSRYRDISMDHLGTVAIPLGSVEQFGNCCPPKLFAGQSSCRSRLHNTKLLITSVNKRQSLREVAAATLSLCCACEVNVGLHYICVAQRWRLGHVSGSGSADGRIYML